MVLVSILGDFHSSIFPIYNEFKNELKTHIVVSDDEQTDRKKTNVTIKMLQRNDKRYGLNTKTIDYVIDEDSYLATMKLVDKIKKLTNDLEQVYINTTDGLSNISVLLANNLLDKGVNILSYDMFENTYNITTKSEILTKKVTKILSIKDHFFLKGLRVEESANKNFAHSFEKEIKSLFEIYRSEFENLKRDITTKQRFNEKQYPHVYTIIHDKMNLTPKNGPMITGGLFEFYIYLLIKDFGFDDIEVGAKVSQEFSSGIKVLNEFDILLMKDNHLHMIECKDTKNGFLADLVYKYSALIDMLDDDGHIMIIKNKDNKYKENIYNKKDNNKLLAHRRALLNRIIVRGNIANNKDAFYKDIEKYFGVSR